MTGCATTVLIICCLQRKDNWPLENWSIKVRRGWWFVNGRISIQFSDTFNGRNNNLYIQVVIFLKVGPLILI